LVGLLLHATCCVQARADGGTVCFSGKAGGYRITVFSAPTPLRAGPVDLSVLVQDAATGEIMPHARVTVRLAKRGGPTLEYAATTEVATNKLFRAAQIELPEPGRWQMHVRVEDVHGLATIGGEIQAAERLPRWREMWPWFTWPAVVIVLFAISRSRQRRSRSEPRAGAGSKPCSQARSHSRPVLPVEHSAG
jgi:hypothetical protein